MIKSVTEDFLKCARMTAATVNKDERGSPVVYAHHELLRRSSQTHDSSRKNLEDDSLLPKFTLSALNSMQDFFDSSFTNTVDIIANMH